jgi:protein TonB
MKKTSFLLLLPLFAAIGLHAQDADGVYTKVDEAPSVTRSVSPDAQKGQAGLVAVICVIDEQGKVISTAISKSTNQVLDESALAAVKKWTFKPAKKDGKVVKVKVTIPLRFSAES